MEIETKKIHTITFTDSELSTLRCFIEDAVDNDVWQGVPDGFPDDLETVLGFYEMARKVVLGGSK